VRFLQGTLSLALGGWLTYELFRALSTGRARGRFLSFERRQDPILFWMVVIVQGGLAVACLFVMIGAWLRHAGAP
jgi:hypothetical protein